MHAAAGKASARAGGPRRGHVDSHLKVANHGPGQTRVRAGSCTRSRQRPVHCGDAHLEAFVQGLHERRGSSTRGAALARIRARSTTDQARPGLVQIAAGDHRPHLRDGSIGPLVSTARSRAYAKALADRRDLDFLHPPLFPGEGVLPRGARAGLRGGGPRSDLRGEARQRGAGPGGGARPSDKVERIEAEIGRLPLSPGQRADLEERLACRYTVLLDIDRRVGHRVLELMGTPRDPEKLRLLLLAQPLPQLRPPALDLFPAHGYGDSFSLPDQYHQPLAPRDTRVDQIPL